MSNSGDLSLSSCSPAAEVSDSATECRLMWLEVLNTDSSLSTRWSFEVFLPLSASACARNWREESRLVRSGPVRTNRRKSQE